MRQIAHHETQSGRLRVTVRVPEQSEAGERQALKTALLRARLAFKQPASRGQAR